jgi:predicted Holliday junction resolvase-like endonuclease
METLMRPMSIDPGLILAAALLASLFILGLFLGIMLGKRSGRGEAERDFLRRIPSERDDAVKRSRAVLTGQFSEQLAPYLPGFPFDPTELRFVGKPVDFVAFVGAASGDISEVVFVEVKTGNSALNKAERSLKAAIEARAVRWVEYRAPQ